MMGELHEITVTSVIAVTALSFFLQGGGLSQACHRAAGTWRP